MSKILFMKFIVSSSEIKKAFQMASTVKPIRTALPIIENFLLEVIDGSLFITSTDLENTIQIELNIDAEENGSFCLPASTILEYLSKVKDQPLTFNISDDNFIQITSENGNYKLLGVNAEDYPKLKMREIVDPNNEIISAKIEIKKLVEAINFTLISIPDLHHRISMTGLFFELKSDKINFVSSDAQRLSFFQCQDINISGSETSFIIPKKSVTQLKSALNNFPNDIEIKLIDKNVYFIGENFKFSSKLIDEKFPDYTAVIPKNLEQKILIHTQDFLSSLKRILVFSNKTSNEVQFQLNGNLLKISTEDIDFSNSGVEELNCNFNGEILNISFIGNQLLENCSCIKSENIEFHLKDNSKGVIVKPFEKTDGIENWCLVMPLKN